MIFLWDLPESILSSIENLRQYVASKFTTIFTTICRVFNAFWKTRFLRNIWIKLWLFSIPLKKGICWSIIMRLLYVWVIDQVCSVKMAGYWQSSFLCVFMDRDEVEVHKLAKKWGQYPAILTEQTWSIKDLLYGFGGNFARGIQREVPSGQDGSILPVRVANLQRAIWFILPARGASHIIILFIVITWQRLFLLFWSRSHISMLLTVCKTCPRTINEKRIPTSNRLWFIITIRHALIRTKSVSNTCTKNNWRRFLSISSSCPWVSLMTN